MELIGIEIALTLSLIGTSIFTLIFYGLYRLYESEWFITSTPLDDWCKLQDKKRFDQDLKRISKIIDKNVRRYNYKNK